MSEKTKKSKYLQCHLGLETDDKKSTSKEKDKKSDKAGTPKKGEEKKSSKSKKSESPARKQERLYNISF